MSDLVPSGEQYRISWGDQEATVVEVGGGVREYNRGGRPVLDPYPQDAMCDGAHGTPLIPWPNRLADGSYHFAGADYQVDLSEPEKHNAIHGFLRWQSWTPSSLDACRVEMVTRINQRPGYPFPLEVSVAYTLGEGGLLVETTASNLGERPCPYGAGQHPYLSPGNNEMVDDCVLQLDAATRIVTDEDRQLPTGRVPVEGTPFDFRGAGRRIGDLRCDFPFTDLGRDAAGRAWARLTGPDDRTVALWVDESHPFIEIYTGDTLAADRRRRGLGSEPMTCPPNAFRSGEHLTILEPGGSMTTSWGVRLD